MIRAVAFDFDGVLVESVDVKTAAFARLFEAEGQAIVDKVVAYHLDHLGISRVEKIRHFYRHYLDRPLTEDQLEMLCDKFRAMVFDSVLAAPWVGGMPETLVECKATGRLLFVVSGTPEDELREIVRGRGIEGYFAGIHGSPAPKSDLLRSILDFHRIAPRELLFVGDATTDYEAAREAGVLFVARARADQFVPWRDRGVPVVADMVSLSSLIGDLSACSNLRSESLPAIRR